MVVTVRFGSLQGRGFCILMFRDIIFHIFFLSNIMLSIRKKEEEELVQFQPLFNDCCNVYMLFWTACMVYDLSLGSLCRVLPSHKKILCWIIQQGLRVGWQDSQCLTGWAVGPLKCLLLVYSLRHSRHAILHFKLNIVASLSLSSFLAMIKQIC